MTTNIWSGGRLVDLTEDECWKLLRSASIGRLVWCDAEPQVVPINFAEHHGELWIRGRDDSHLTHTCDGRPVAFEVDEIDEFTRSGVSVVVHGTGRERTMEEMISSDAYPDSWPEGPTSGVLSISVASVTGRRLLPS